MYGGEKAEKIEIQDKQIQLVLPHDQVPVHPLLLEIAQCGLTCVRKSAWVLLRMFISLLVMCACLRGRVRMCACPLLSQFLGCNDRNIRAHTHTSTTMVVRGTKYTK